jgi:cellobiose dehydrogenase (acceptor)
MTEGSYTDAETGIKLKTWTATDGAPFTFGLALPSDALTKDATEYIGLLVGSQNASRH